MVGFTLRQSCMFGELWYAVLENDILLGVWVKEDIPEIYKHLLEEIIPIYDYECLEHGTFEALKKIADREIAKCPECGEECKQSLSAPAMVKGGFCDKSMKFSKGKA